ncbi:alpha-hydroxy-acid oxidizing protein [Vitreimonas flagellata]|uniref:alpha-hydroxy-acid oxidizing protein n=1 Tax=Vitreimonas flagellata TaxID=2560861 RepID=UPI00107565AF|nr:alpha-hydroxy-acid oxidizing protein [Vitreimonas flagellata]
MSDTPRHFGPEIQGGVYLRGLGGAKPEIPTSFPGLEAAAKAKMSPEAWAYTAGAAGLESSMDANRAAFARYPIAPRMLGGAGQRDLSCEMFGVKAAAPLFSSPIGVLEMMHPEADLAVARAMAALNMPMMISSQASTPMEKIAEANGSGPRFFQLYWGKSDAIAESFVKRAEAIGCKAIFITLDTTVLGWRPRDMDLGFLPFLRAQGIAQYTSDPVFRAMLPAPPEENPMAAAVAFTQVFSDPGLDWARIAKIRSWTKLPVVLKGIMRGDDAARAVAEGYDGVMVSNHGGRQVDGGIGALDALSEVVPAVNGKAPVYFDSGIRCGADAFKALALGAHAVGIGRPYAYGLAIAGENGVKTVMEYLAAELDLTMALMGTRTPADIHRDSLRLNAD